MDTFFYGQFEGEDDSEWSRVYYAEQSAAWRATTVSSIGEVSFAPSYALPEDSYYPPPIAGHVTDLSDSMVLSPTPADSHEQAESGVGSQNVSTSASTSPENAAPDLGEEVYPGYRRGKRDGAIYEVTRKGKIGKALIDTGGSYKDGEVNREVYRYRERHEKHERYFAFVRRPQKEKSSAGRSTGRSRREFKRVEIKKGDIKWPKKPPPFVRQPYRLLDNGNLLSNLGLLYELHKGEDTQGRLFQAEDSQGNRVFTVREGKGKTLCYYPFTKDLIRQEQLLSPKKDITWRLVPTNTLAFDGRPQQRQQRAHTPDEPRRGSGPGTALVLRQSLLE